jgi:hypothetical protein
MRAVQSVNQSKAKRGYSKRFRYFGPSLIRVGMEIIKKQPGRVEN